MVNPALFPNTVMNCAAGQSAIWFGLNGVNATVAGGPLAFLSVLRYCLNAFRGRQADHLLAGAVEEFTPHNAWMSHAAAPAAGVPAGEGGAVFLLAPQGSGPGERGRDGEVLSVALGFSPDRRRVEALAGCLRRALSQARVDPGEVAVVVADPGGDALAERAHRHAVADVLGRAAAAAVERPRVTDLVGDCQSATGALALALILAAHRVDAARDGQVSVLTAYTREGGVGAAVVRGWHRGDDRG
jgi:3-oxoacyl-[acyl-carrier-protein] synthase II